MEDSIYLGDNLEVLPTLPDDSFQLVTPIRPSTRACADATGRRDRRGRPMANAPDSRDAATDRLRGTPTRDRSTTTSASLSRAWRGSAGAPPDRNALPPPRLPRGALRQAPLRRALRPRAVAERDHLGLRLRRARQAPLAGQSATRSSSTSRMRGTTASTPRPSTAAVHGAQSRTAEKAARGKLPTDAWWHTIVSPTGRRRPATRRRNHWACCAAPSRPPPAKATGASILCGRGTLGAAAADLGGATSRRFESRRGTR